MTEIGDSLFHKCQDVWVMQPDGSAITRLTETPGVDQQPSWSPNGKQIVFSSRRDGNG